MARNEVNCKAITRSVASFKTKFRKLTLIFFSFSSAVTTPQPPQRPWLPLAEPDRTKPSCKLRNEALSIVKWALCAVHVGVLLNPRSEHFVLIKRNGLNRRKLVIAVFISRLDFFLVAMLCGCISVIIA